MMKYKILLSFTLLLNTLQAQTYSDYSHLWSTYVGPQGSHISFLQKDSDGNIITHSSVLLHELTFSSDPRVYNYYKSYTFPQTEENMFTSADTGVGYLAKFTPDGVLLQAKYLPYDLISLKPIANNNYLAKVSVDRSDLGTTSTWLTNPPVQEDNQYEMIMKLDENFNIIWASYLPKSAGVLDLDKIDEFGNIYGAVSTKIDTGLTTIGSFYPYFTYDIDNLNVHRNPNNSLIFKLNSDGQLIWSTYYGTNNPMSLELKDNILYVGFSEGEEVSEYFPDISYDAALVETTPNILAKFNAGTGERIYATYFGEDNRLYAPSFILHNNSIYITGAAYDSLSTGSNLVTSNAYQSTFAGRSDGYFAKLDLDFNVVWGTYVGGNLSESFNSLKLFNNHIYLLGNAGSSNFLHSGTIFNPISSGGILGDGMVLKFNLDGELIWGTLFGGEDEDAIINVILTDEKTLYFYGYTTSHTGIATPGASRTEPYLLSNYWDMRFSFLAKFGEEKPLSFGDLSTSTLKIYPNPAKDKVYIQGFIHQDSTIEIYNLVGQKVITQKSKSGLTQTIDVQFLPKGTYIIKATDINGKSFQEKLLIN